MECHAIRVRHHDVQAAAPAPPALRARHQARLVPHVHAPPSAPLRARAALEQLRLDVVVHADHRRVAVDQGEVARQRERIHVYQVEAARPEQVDEARRHRRGIVGEVSVRPAQSHAAHVVPRQAPDAVLLRHRKGFDVGERSQGGESLCEVQRWPGPALAANEAQRRHVERARQDPQHVEAADGHSRIRGIWHRLAQEQQAGATAHADRR